MRRPESVYPATIVGIPPMEDFYIGGASVELFLPISKMNFSGIVDIALPVKGVFHNLVFVSIRKTYPRQKITNTECEICGFWRIMFTKYLVVLDDECLSAAAVHAQHQRSPLPPLRQHVTASFISPRCGGVFLMVETLPRQSVVPVTARGKGEHWRPGFIGVASKRIANSACFFAA